MKNILSIIFLFFLGFVVNGQEKHNHTLSGTITDVATGEELIGATADETTSESMFGKLNDILENASSGKQSADAAFSNSTSKNGSWVGQDNVQRNVHFSLMVSFNIDYYFLRQTRVRALPISILSP